MIGLSNRDKLATSFEWPESDLNPIFCGELRYHRGIHGTGLKRYAMVR